MSIRLSALLATTPEAAFQVLTQTESFSKLTAGAPCQIDPAPGGEFSLFGGMIHGRNIEVLPGVRIVQAWRVKAWPEGLYSLVRFSFRATGEGTQFEVEHTAYPEAQMEHLSKGWQENYIEPLRKMFG